MIYRIVHHPAVEQDILGILAFLLPYTGLERAQTISDEITDFISTLTDFPKIGTLRNELRTGLRAIPFEQAVICFVVDDATQTVTIICIGYAGSDWSARVTERT